MRLNPVRIIRQAAGIVGLPFGATIPVATAARDLAFEDGATPSEAVGGRQEPTTDPAAEAAQFGVEQRTLARRRRRRSSLLATVGMGDPSELPTTLPSATPRKTTFGA